MVGRAAVGRTFFREALRTVSLLTIGCAALLTGAGIVPAAAAPAAYHPQRRTGRVYRRLWAPPPVAEPIHAHGLLHHVTDHPHPARHPLVHRPDHHWVHRVVYRHPAPHAAIRHPWHPAAHVIRAHGRVEHMTRHAVWRHPVYAPRMSCVPFARADSGIKLAGDAYAWWDHAAGVYARGDAPVPGSVLAFRANTRMRLGHVAVVARVINRREIEVDQSNWGDGGRITRGVPVIDVSEDNDWTEVRVSLGDGRFGSVYPTHGFIYDRPDTGVMLAARHTPAPELAANPAPSDLRALHRDGDEVAELPGPLPAPPHWPTRLGHSLHTSFAHHDVRHVAYRHQAVSHWAPHHGPVHHEVLHRVALREAPARRPAAAP